MLEPSERIESAGIRVSLETLTAFERFVGIVRLLRRACPWDREQSPASIRHLLIEEAYETVEAIDREDWPELKKELGDLMLHVVFHAVMAEEERRFDLDAVLEAASEKLVRRHPHVFGDTEADSTKEVLRNWERIKAESGEKRSHLAGVPADLPALLRAFRIQEKAAGVGFDFSTPEEAWTKVEEELGEFRELFGEDAPDAAESELGDLLFALVNFARLEGLNPEMALRRTNEKFRRRFQRIEARVKEEGRSMHEVSLREMDAIWEEAKAEE